MELTADFKQELSLLKKINQVGKKMTEEGIYVMSRGLLLSYEKDNPHISIGFLNEKNLSLFDYDYFCDHNILVDGPMLYKLCSKGMLTGYKVTKKGFEFFFEVDEEVTPEFNLDDFCYYCVKRGYTDYDARVAFGKGFGDNMEIYNLYLKYKNTLKPHDELVKYKFSMPFVDLKNEVINKVLTTLKNTAYEETIFTKKLSERDLEQLNEGMPVEINFNDPRVTFKPAYAHLMKSMFLTISTSSELSIEITTDYKFSNHIITTVNNGENYVKSIFKIIII